MAVTAGTLAYQKDAAAVACSASKTENISMDVSQQLSSGTNIKGRVKTYSTVTGGYQFRVECTGNPKDFIYTNMRPGGNFPVAWTDGPWTYYRVDDYFSIALSWSDCSGTHYIPTPPFHGFCLNGIYPVTVENMIQMNGSIPGKEWMGRTRTTWTLKLRVERAFSGPRPVNLRNLFRYYYGDIASDRATVELLSLAGNITVPETCTINAGQIIQVNLGDVGAGRFGGKGQKPDGYTPVTTSAPVTCNDAAAQRNVRVSLAATPSPDLNTAIRTSNPDVGVVVTDVNDRVVQPNVDTLPLRLQSNGAGSNNGTVTMKAYPVSTTGRPPAQGNFSATAAITVTFD